MVPAATTEPTWRCPCLRGSPGTIGKGLPILPLPGQRQGRAQSRYTALRLLLHLGPISACLEQRFALGMLSLITWPQGSLGHSHDPPSHWDKVNSEHTKERTDFCLSVWQPLIWVRGVDAEASGRKPRHTSSTGGESQGVPWPGWTCPNTFPVSEASWKKWLKIRKVLTLHTRYWQWENILTSTTVFKFYNTLMEIYK